jgi:hypothetical protein
MSDIAVIPLMVLVPFLLIFLGFVIQNITQFLHTRRIMALKQDMLDKGMSAADIERVLQASAVGVPAGVLQPSTAILASAKGPGFDKARLIQTMAEHGLDGEGIERVLCALGDFSDDEVPAKIAAMQSMLENGMSGEDIERVIRAFGRAPAQSSDAPARESEWRVTTGGGRRATNP